MVVATEDKTNQSVAIIGGKPNTKIAIHNAAATKNPIHSDFLKVAENQKKLTKSLCSSFEINGVNFVIPTNIKNTPKRMDRLFNTIEEPILNEHLSRFSSG